MNRRQFVGVLAAGTTAALAGCVTDSPGTGPGTTDRTTEEPTEVETTAEPTTEDATTDGGDAEDATVAVGSTDEYGDVLVDAEGMSLYLFTQDEDGESTCYDGCEDNWPPLTADGDGEPAAGDGVTAELGTTEREDGSTQVTAAGSPLYYFAGDSEPGDTAGQGVGDVWFLLAPDGSQVGGENAETTESATTESGGDGGSGGTY